MAGERIRRRADRGEDEDQYPVGHARGASEQRPQQNRRHGEHGQPHQHGNAEAAVHHLGDVAAIDVEQRIPLVYGIWR